MNIVKTTRPYQSLYNSILTEINPTAEEIESGYLLHRDCGMKAHVISNKSRIPNCNISFEDLKIPKIQLAVRPMYDPYKYPNQKAHIREKAEVSIERLIDFEVFRLLSAATPSDHTIKTHITKINDEVFNSLIGILEYHDLQGFMFIMNPATYREIELQLTMSDKEGPKKYRGRYDIIPIYTSTMCQRNVILLTAPKEYVGVIVNYGQEEQFITTADNEGFEIIKEIGLAVVNDYAVAKIACTI